MSVPIKIQDNDDLPCNDWNHKPQCPMAEKWHEGETRMCAMCGWGITYAANDD